MPDLYLSSLVRHRLPATSRRGRILGAWRFALLGTMVTVRVEAILFFVVQALMLDLLIMPWALDTHPLAHMPQLHHAVRVTRHASPLLRHSGTLALTVLSATAALAHEFGHALALRRVSAAVPVPARAGRRAPTAPS